MTKTITTTPEHPFYVSSKEKKPWTGAGELEVDDEIRKADGNVGIVLFVRTKLEKRVMYNLSVSNNHNFFVRDQGWLTHNCEWTPHGYKHFPQKNMDWPDIVKTTRSGPAKYFPGTDVEALEREIWKNGKPVTNGKTWKVQEFDQAIGASNGKASRWIRVEYSGNTIHGHPITQEEYRKLLK